MSAIRLLSGLATFWQKIAAAEACAEKWLRIFVIYKVKTQKIESWQRCQLFRYTVPKSSTPIFEKAIGHAPLGAPNFWCDFSWV